MTQRKKIFLTTTLPYVNSKPHIGHMFEFLIGDSLTRFFRSSGREVFFNTGLDEHGLKVYSAAKNLGITTENYIESLTNYWLEFCKLFSIEYDNFYKTSTAEHHKKFNEIWNHFMERGDLYEKDYKGLYCIGCESFKTEKEIVDGKCSDHPTLELKEIAETNWHFDLSKYRDSLLQWISDSPEFLHPKSKLSEMGNLIWDMSEMSVSRIKEKVPWGIEVPNDASQTVYCWMEALCNYILAAGYLSDKNTWNNDTEIIQICGPDNLKFQAIIFQAILEAEGLKKSDQLIVHGTILDSAGKKMSKSEGNVIDPIEQLEKYGLDAVRYYALCGLSTFTNSGWDENELKVLFNSNICNSWGNLVSRTLHLMDSMDSKIVHGSITPELFESIDTLGREIDFLWKQFKIKEALQKTNELVSIGNKYINDKKPWAEKDPEKVSWILSDLYQLIQIVGFYYNPIFPGKKEILEQALESKKKVILFNKIL